MLIIAEELERFDKLKKVQLATSLPGVKPACLVGTKDSSGQENLSLFSSITHFGSSPLILGMVTRPDTVARHTLENILETKVWTLSHITPEILSQAHQCSAKYPKEVSEFVATGLTPDYPEPEFHAPAVLEARVKMGLSLKDIIDIPINGTKLIVGQVEWVDLMEGALETDGSLGWESLGSLGSTALDTYFTVTEHARLAYARP